MALRSKCTIFLVVSFYILTFFAFISEYFAFKVHSRVQMVSHWIENTQFATRIINEHMTAT